MELLEQQPEIDCLVAPVGGGGLIAGTCVVAAHINPAIKVYAAEPEMANDAYNSFKAGELKHNTHSPTIAEGLRVNIFPMNLAILQKYAADVLTVS